MTIDKAHKPGNPYYIIDLNLRKGPIIIEIGLDKNKSYWTKHIYFF